MRVAVAGGTGVVGKLVVSVAEERGHDVVVLSRARGVDLTSVGDLAQRLVGVDTVIDVSGTRTQRRRSAREFFTGVTTTLLTAGDEAGVGHHVALSIVGIEGVDSGYYAAKLAQEQLVAGGPLPWTILRATQFHEFAAQALDFLRLGPVALVPRMRTQPVAAREVAQALVGIVETGPAGRVPDLAGPQVHQLVDLARRVNRERGRHGLVVGVPLPGRAGQAMGAGVSYRPPRAPAVTSPSTPGWVSMDEAELATAFHTHRPRLIRVAYAVLGSVTEAGRLPAGTAAACSSPWICPSRSLPATATARPPAKCSVSSSY